MKTIGWILFIFFAIIIGLYPVAYIFFDMKQGLLASKTPELLQSKLWQTAFYQHIFFGGLALLIGWTQFIKKFRDRYLAWHRLIGKVYLFSILFSGTAGFYIAMFATAGIISITGFSGLALAWMGSSLMAYLAIRKGQIDDHQYWMIRSYALCFAAVTLRIWLPLFQFGFEIDFFTAYRIIAWLCWVPNLIVAELIIRNIKTSQLKPDLA